MRTVYGLDRCRECGKPGCKPVQVNYNLARHPRFARGLCDGCRKAAEAAEAPSKLRAQMDQVVDFDKAFAGCGLSPEEREARFRAAGLGEAFDALMEALD